MQTFYSPGLSPSQSASLEVQSFKTFYATYYGMTRRMLPCSAKLQIIAGGLSTVIQPQWMSMGFPFCNCLHNFHAPLWNLFFMFFPPLI